MFFTFAPVKNVIIMISKEENILFAAEKLFAELKVRGNTGLGAEKASSH